jgi:hypothetical protein
MSYQSKVMMKDRTETKGAELDGSDFSFFGEVGKSIQSSLFSFSRLMRDSRNCRPNYSFFAVDDQGRSARQTVRPST